MANLISMLKIANLLNNKKHNAPVTDATLNVSENEIEIIINGIPSVIEIQYNGGAILNSLMPYFITSNINKNSILISNILRYPFPKKIYSYSGDIRVVGCKILNYDGTLVYTSINNLHDTDKIGRSNTNIEDEDLILFADDKTKKEIKRGFSFPSIVNNLNELEIGKRDKQIISKSRVKDINLKDTVSKKNIQEQQKSTVSKPVKQIPKTQEKGKY